MALRDATALAVDPEDDLEAEVDALNARYGTSGANRALDKISTSMANTYGQGHPWLNCAQLKQATRSLAQNRAPGALLAAADTLLGDSARVSLTAAY